MRYWLLYWSVAPVSWNCNLNDGEGLAPMQMVEVIRRVVVLVTYEAHQLGCNVKMME